MKNVILSLLIIIGLSSQTHADKSISEEDFFGPEEVLAPLDIFQSEGFELFKNEQAPVWCVTYCRALRNQCELTYSYGYCVQEFGDCMDECLDPPGGGGSGGGGGNDDPPTGPIDPV